MIHKKGVYAFMVCVLLMFYFALNYDEKMCIDWLLFYAQNNSKRTRTIEFENNFFQGYWNRSVCCGCVCARQTVQKLLKWSYQNEIFSMCCLGYVCACVCVCEKASANDIIRWIYMIASFNCSLLMNRPHSVFGYMGTFNRVLFHGWFWKSFSAIFIHLIYQHF